MCKCSNNHSKRRRLKQCYAFTFIECSSFIFIQFIVNVKTKNKQNSIALCRVVFQYRSRHVTSEICPSKQFKRFSLSFGRTRVNEYYYSTTYAAEREKQRPKGNVRGKIVHMRSSTTTCAQRACVFRRRDSSRTNTIGGSVESRKNGHAGTRRDTTRSQNGHGRSSERGKQSRIRSTMIYTTVPLQRNIITVSYTCTIYISRRPPSTHPQDGTPAVFIFAPFENRVSTNPNLGLVFEAARRKIFRPSNNVRTNFFFLIRSRRKN